MNLRRALLLGLGASAIAGAAPAPRGALVTRHRPVPFAAGDVVVGCTLLDNPADDHAGRGRLLHYDANLKLRNTIWLDDTTHIVQGVQFGPDRTLWAFDSFAYRILRFSPDGRRLPNFTQAPARSFAHVTFARDGSFYLGENFVGEKSRVPLRTTLPFMPGTKRLGDGHLFHFSRDGRLLRQYPTATHGGMGGFQGLTASALSADEKTIYYTSESGPKIFHYDLTRATQLPDFLSFPDNSGRLFFDLAFDRQQRLLVVTGRGVDALDPRTARVVRSYVLPGFGWASMSRPAAQHVYVTNFFSGAIVRLDLASGEVVAQADVGIKRSLSGVAEFPG